LTFRYLLKFILYYFLTQPSVHRYTRSLYEGLGHFQPLPTPTDTRELRGLRPPGYERRLSNAQAAIGVRQLKNLPDNIRQRDRISSIYEDLLAGGGGGPLRGNIWTRPVLVRYPLLVRDREGLERDSRSDLVLGKWFTSVLEEAEDPGCGDYTLGSCPQAEYLARHLVNLPNHLRVTDRDARRLAALVADHILPGEAS
jgi:dTDP-4-amino-4,6-dideoxygalactose transaminase